MSTFRKAFGVMLIIFSFSSCKKEGCTDCNATNYNASVDDMSCEYENEDKVGIYIVSDSITDPFQTTFFNTYKIEIKRSECNATEMVIYNYSDIKNSQNESISVVCQISGDTIRVANQIIEGPDMDATTDYLKIFQSKGYFSKDSIYMDLSYTDRFDPYFGMCWREKK